VGNAITGKRKSKFIGSLTLNSRKIATWSKPWIASKFKPKTVRPIGPNIHSAAFSPASLLAIALWILFSLLREAILVLNASISRRPTGFQRIYLKKYSE